MATRTEQHWTALFDATVTSIIDGRCSNSYYGDYSIDSILSEAISGAGAADQTVLRAVSATLWRPHRGPDGAGGTQHQAEHRRRVHRRADQHRDGAEAAGRRARQQ